MRSVPHLKISVLPVVFSVLVVGLMTFSPVGAAVYAKEIHSNPSDCGAWNVIPGANPGVNSNGFGGVAAISVSDVWAVGAYFNDETGLESTLVENWNGSSWNVVTSPDPGTSENSLSAVAYVPHTNQLWAVGWYANRVGNFTGPSKTLIEHWNGKKWSVVYSPNVHVSDNQLSSVTVVSATDIWAVGSHLPSNSSNAEETLIEHWNGTKWSIISSPSPGTNANDLIGVVATSAHNIWAVGYYRSNFYYQTLIEQWNGQQWNVITSPNPGTGDNSLSEITRIPGTNHLWAAGSYDNSGSSTGLSLFEYYDGQQWNVVAGGNPGTEFNNIVAVTSISTSNIWAAGYYSNINGVFQTLIEYWNGISWNVVASPNVGPYDNYLESITSIPGTTSAWATGWYNTSNSGGFYTKTLTEFYC